MLAVNSNSSVHLASTALKTFVKIRSRGISPKVAYPVDEDEPAPQERATYRQVVYTVVCVEALLFATSDGLKVWMT
jgi:hypothetical protein